jgi:histidinol-phosphate aminotransferase
VVAELNKIRLPYNINSLSQSAAVAALRHRDVVERQISVLISEREKLYNALSRLPGITAYPSETNFLLLRTEQDATAIHGRLKHAGILVKNLDRPGPLKSCLRVTVGTPAQNREFLKSLQQIIS